LIYHLFLKISCSSHLILLRIVSSTLTSLHICISKISFILLDWKKIEGGWVQIRATITRFSLIKDFIKWHIICKQFKPFSIKRLQKKSMASSVFIFRYKWSRGIINVQPSNIGLHKNKVIHLIPLYTTWQHRSHRNRLTAVISHQQKTFQLTAFHRQSSVEVIMVPNLIIRCEDQVYSTHIYPNTKHRNQVNPTTLL
jgi:hypothetical protein